jgi:hypothetical protein
MQSLHDYRCDRLIRLKEIPHEIEFGYEKDKFSIVV